MRFKGAKLLILITAYRYFKNSNHHTITYDGMVSLIQFSYGKKYKLETIQREMRKLARLGYFDRIYSKSHRNPSSNTVLYKPTTKLFEYFDKQQIREGTITNGQVKTN